MGSVRLIQLMETWSDDNLPDQSGLIYAGFELNALEYQWRKDQALHILWKGLNFWFTTLRAMSGHKLPALFGAIELSKSVSSSLSV